MKKLILCIILAIVFVGGGVGLGVYLTNRNSTATSVATLSFESESVSNQSNSSQKTLNASSNQSSNGKEAKVQFVLNSQNKVISATLLNSDADLLCASLELNGKTIADASLDVTNAAIKAGVCDLSGRNYVNLQIVAKDEQTAKGIESSVKAKVNNLFDEYGIYGTVMADMNVNIKKLTNKYSDVLESLSIDASQVKDMTEQEILQTVKEQSKKVEKLAGEQVEALNDYCTATFQSIYNQINSILDIIDNATSSLSGKLSNLISDEQINKYKEEVKKLRDQIVEQVSQKITELQAQTKTIFDNCKTQYQTLTESFNNQLETYKQSFENNKVEILVEINAWRETVK